MTVPKCYYCDRIAERKYYILPLEIRGTVVSDDVDVCNRCYNFKEVFDKNFLRFCRSSLLCEGSKNLGYKVNLPVTKLHELYFYCLELCEEAYREHYV